MFTYSYIIVRYHSIFWRDMSLNSGIGIILKLYDSPDKHISKYAKNVMNNLKISCILLIYYYIYIHYK